MNRFNNLSKQNPVAFTLLLVATCIAMLYSRMLFGIENTFYNDLWGAVSQNVITVGLVYLLIKFDWLEGSLLLTPFNQWHKKWWLAAMPMAMIAALNLMSLEFDKLVFDSTKALGWLYASISTGVFEEVLLRGVCFYVLYNAWKHKSNGLILAAVTQAFIFGLAHFSNAMREPLIEVSIQVLYATLIGVGFAGLVAYSRSLWPAIVIHALINAIGDIDNYFQPDFVASDMTLTNYAVAVSIIALICALPGYFLLKKTQKRMMRLSSQSQSQPHNLARI